MASKNGRELSINKWQLINNTEKEKMKLLKNLSISLTLCLTTSAASALDLSEAMDLAQQYDTTFQAAYAEVF